MTCKSKSLLHFITVFGKTYHRREYATSSTWGWKH